MKNLKTGFVLFILTILVFCSIVYLSPKNVFSEDRTVKLSTADLNEPYKILGIVSYRTGFPDLDKINRQLRNQAEKLGANYVIEIRYVSYAGYLFGYGTAVKTK